MNLEKIWYELSPYGFALAGTLAVLYGPGSILLKGSGFLLFAAALTAVVMRWISRSQATTPSEPERERPR